MVQRARSGRQLAIELPPELLQRLKAQAAAEERTVASLVRRWIEVGLSGALKSSSAAPSAGGDLVERLEALEAAVAALQQKKSRPASGNRRSDRDDASSPRPRGASEALPQQGRPHKVDVPAGVITTADLAVRIGMKRGTLNERIRRAGGACIGLEMEGWRCVGHHRPEGGGPPRWLWEPV